MPPRIWSFTTGFAAGVALAFFWVTPAFAQPMLTRAEIYKLRNQVDIERQNQGVWKPAAVGDALVPQDAVRTAARSRAELLFNEGTLVRTGEGTIFRFPPGKRRFELTNGAALIMIRPGLGQSKITTPEAQVVSQGTALFIQHNASRNASLVGVLSNSPAGPVRVSSANGDVTVELKAGQFVSIINGTVGLVKHFILPMFYESVELAAGLGTGQKNLVAQNPPEAQKTINAVRAETLAPLRQQRVWLERFCSSNVETSQESQLLQLLRQRAKPLEELISQLPEGDLFVSPFQSLRKRAWLSNYCQTHQN
jgi:hypothetical protein